MIILTQSFVNISFILLTCLGTAPTRGPTGPQNQTISSGRPGIYNDGLTGSPGLQTTSSMAGVVSPGVTGYPGLQRTTFPFGKPGLHTTTGEKTLLSIIQKPQISLYP